jgi:DNA helicase-2/ATP-dependent DNA helicase PcrA
MIPVMIENLKVNDEQLAAVTSESKRILCLAGAGTGKTTTLTSRIANLNKNRVSCSDMLALTFTRLAGKEMKERVINIVGKSEGSKLFCNTFHAFCAEVIREHGSVCGFDHDFSIYDEDDTRAIIKDIIAEYKYKDAKVDEVLTLLRNPAFEVLNLEYTDGSLSAYEEFIWRLERNNALDFDSLIKYAKDILMHTDILKEY